jgi:short subunit dehydrogenase-like uncharacterized protein
LSPSFNIQGNFELIVKSLALGATGIVGGYVVEHLVRAGEVAMA